MSDEKELPKPPINRLDYHTASAPPATSVPLEKDSGRGLQREPSRPISRKSASVTEQRIRDANLSTANLLRKSAGEKIPESKLPLVTVGNETIKKHVDKAKAYVNREYDSDEYIPEIPQVDRTSNKAISEGATSLINSKFSKSDRAIANLFNASLVEQRVQTKEAATSSILMRKLYDFNTKVGMTYMAKSLSLKYQNVYLAREQVSLLETISDILDSKLEAIKRNTGVSELNKRTIVDIIRENSARHIANKVSEKIHNVIGKKVVDPLIDRATTAVKDISSSFIKSDAPGAGTVRLIRDKIESSKSTADLKYKNATNYIKSKIDGYEHTNEDDPYHDPIRASAVDRFQRFKESEAGKSVINRMNKLKDKSVDARDYTKDAVEDIVTQVREAVDGLKGSNPPPDTLSSYNKLKQASQSNKLNENKIYKTLKRGKDISDSTLDFVNRNRNKLSSFHTESVDKIQNYLKNVDGLTDVQKTAIIDVLNGKISSIKDIDVKSIASEKYQDVVNTVLNLAQDVRGITPDKLKLIAELARPKKYSMDQSSPHLAGDGDLDVSNLLYDTTSTYTGTIGKSTNRSGFDASAQSTYMSLDDFINSSNRSIGKPETAKTKLLDALINTKQMASDKINQYTSPEFINNMKDKANLKNIKQVSLTSVVSHLEELRKSAIEAGADTTTIDRMIDMANARLSGDPSKIVGELSVKDNIKHAISEMIPLDMFKRKSNVSDADTSSVPLDDAIADTQKQSTYTKLKSVGKSKLEETSDTYTSIVDAIKNTENENVKKLISAQSKLVDKISEKYDRLAEILVEKKDEILAAKSDLKVPGIGGTFGSSNVEAGITITGFDEWASEDIQRTDIMIELLKEISVNTSMGYGGDGTGVPHEPAPTGLWGKTKHKAKKVYGAIKEVATNPVKYAAKGAWWAAKKTANAYIATSKLSYRMGKGLLKLAIGSADHVPFRDVYRKDNPNAPLLTVSQLKEGLVKGDGSPIIDVRDITEPVFDPKTGNMLVTEEDIKAGLVDGLGKPLRKLRNPGLMGVLDSTVRGGVKVAGIFAKAGGGIFGKTLDLYGRGITSLGMSIFGSSEVRYTDVYRKDNRKLGKPLIKARDIRNGLCVFEDGTPVERVSEINRQVFHRDTGEILIDDDDIKAGLVDVFGKPISKLSNSGGLFRGLGSMVGGAFKGIGMAAGGIGLGLGMITKPMLNLYGTLLKGMFSIGKGVVGGGMGILGRLFGGKGDGTGASRKDLEEVVGSRLDEILELLYDRLKDHSIAGDVDGDGIRENSYLDRIRKKKEDRANKINEKISEATNSKSGMGMLGALGAGMSSIKDAITGKKKEGDEEEGGGGWTDAIVTGLAATLGSKIPGWKAIKGGAGKLAGKIGLGKLFKGGAGAAAGAAGATGAGAAAKVAGASAAAAATSGASIAAKAAGRSALKKIPILGLVAGGAFAISRLTDGDFVGAGAELLSGAASLVPFIGTGASLAIDSALLYRDINANSEEPADLIVKERMKLYGVTDTDRFTFMLALEDMVRKVMLGKRAQITNKEYASIANQFGLDASDPRSGAYIRMYIERRMVPILIQWQQIVSSASGGDGETEVDPKDIINKLIMSTKSIISERGSLTPDINGFNKVVKDTNNKIEEAAQSSVKPNIRGASVVAASVSPETIINPDDKNTSNAVPTSNDNIDAAATYGTVKTTQAVAISSRQASRHGGTGPSITNTSNSNIQGAANQNYSNPNGQNVVIPPFTGKVVAPSGDKLGQLSANYESGKRGSSAIGYDGKGGTSYGKYQIASKTGTFKNFLSWLRTKGEQGNYVADVLQSAGPANTGSRNGGVPSAWKQLAESGALGDLEHQFIKETHYDIAYKKLPQEIKQMVDQSHALQDVLWSTAVQHGGGTKVFSQAWRENNTPEEFIRRIYDVRSTKFGGSDAKTRASVLNRFAHERQVALAMYEQDKLVAKTKTEVTANENAENATTGTVVSESAPAQSNSDTGAVGAAATAATPGNVLATQTTANEGGSPTTPNNTYANAATNASATVPSSSDAPSSNNAPQSEQMASTQSNATRSIASGASSNDKLPIGTDITAEVLAKIFTEANAPVVNILSRINDSVIQSSGSLGDVLKTSMGNNKGNNVNVVNASMNNRGSNLDMKDAMDINTKKRRAGGYNT